MRFAQAKKRRTLKVRFCSLLRPPPPFSGTTNPRYSALTVVKDSRARDGTGLCGEKEAYELKRRMVRESVSVISVSHGPPLSLSSVSLSFSERAGVPVKRGRIVNKRGACSAPIRHSFPLRGWRQTATQSRHLRARQTN